MKRVNLTFSDGLLWERRDSGHLWLAERDALRYRPNTEHGDSLSLAGTGRHVASTRPLLQLVTNWRVAVPTRIVLIPRQRTDGATWTNA